MKTSKYLMVAAALLMSLACNGTQKSDTNVKQREDGQGTAAIKTDGKALVVFFSHAGENYSVGNVKTGNTKVVADYITELTGANQFEIKTDKYDGMAYKPLCDLAKEEQEKGELPPFEGEPASLDQYDTVFIGGPVWWGTFPQVMFSFFKKYDLNGKTLIPFTTHEGSGLGNCVDDAKEAYPNAVVTGAFSLYGHEVRTGKDKVEKWLKKLGFIK